MAWHRSTDPDLEAQPDRTRGGEPPPGEVPGGRAPARRAAACEGLAEAPEAVS